MTLDLRAASGQIDGFGNRDHEDTMRVAHPHRRRRPVDRQRIQRDVTCQRDARPVQHRRSHVHPELAISDSLCRQNAPPRSEGEPVAPGFLGQQSHGAAAGVAAGIRPRAVRVPEIHRRIRCVIIAQHRELVETHAAMPVAERTRQSRP